MATAINVPPLGESVTEAVIARWTKQVGEYAKADEMLVELETDKVTLEVNAPVAGVITEQAFKEGDTVEVGAVLGQMDESAKAPAGAATSESKSDAKAASAPAKADAAAILSPAAQKLSKESGLTPAAGTGKDGRVTKGDVINAINTGGVAAPAKREERVRMTRLRQSIAKRLKDSQDTAAILTTFNEIDMSHVMKLRKQYQDSFVKKHDVKLGFMSFFIKAAIAALKEIPSVNAEIQGDEIVYKQFYDISVAVGTPQGLVVPVVRDADAMSFAEIEKTIVGLGKKAREGKLTIEEMTGGTFTISNGGVYGSLLSTPIINPPQTGILGLHKIQERPIAANGEVVVRPMMYTALSYDHRLIDGGEAVTFLVRIKEAMEDPQRLLLDV